MNKCKDCEHFYECDNMGYYEQCQKEYIIMPEGCRWYTVKALSPNTAFLSQSCFFTIGKKIAVMDEEQERCWLYTVE